MEKKELVLVKYIKEHGLAKAIKEFTLTCKVYDKKILLKYSQIDSPMGAKETQDARGLILERDTWKVMCLTFQKFFNAEEGHAAKIDWDTARVLKKEDGSLIQLYWDWHKEEWCVATSGMAEAEGEINNRPNTTFAQLFWETIEKMTDDVELFKTRLDTNFCYAFELTTPYNVVVTPHSTSKAILLSCRHVATLNELSYDEISLVSNVSNVPLIESYPMNVKDVGAIKRTFEGMPFTEEGYVVVDGNFNRIKIKNPAYVAVHHLKSKTGAHNIMGVVKSNEIEEFAATFIERREEIFGLHERYVILTKELNDIWDGLQDSLPKSIEPKERKKFAVKVGEALGKKHLQFSGLFFGLKDGKVDSVEEYLFNHDNRRLYKYLKE